MNIERFKKLVEFVRVIDDLKSVERKNITIKDHRWENSAEHSWHASLMVMLFSDPSFDAIRAIKMLLIHDIVEIEVGDTFAHSDYDPEEKRRKEEIAAKNIFGILPKDLYNEFYSLWIEFEENKTPASIIANTMDRLQPFIIHTATGGKQWKQFGVSADKVRKRMEPLKNLNSNLYQFINEMINEAEKDGWFSIDVGESFCEKDKYDAFLVKEFPPVYNSITTITHKVYRCDPPLEGCDFVCVSASDIYEIGPETYIFPCDEDGKITQFIELYGSYKGGLDHELALFNAGYSVRQKSRKID